MKSFITYLCLCFIIFTNAAFSEGGVQTMTKADSQCPAFLNHEFKKLHSTDTINLCEQYKNKALLIVNTASHCGYTKQFAPLEELNQKYKDKGLQIIGFASDDFNQEAKDEKEAATICYENYGVTFTMLAPTHVKGDNANPVFAHLGKQTAAPSWNFNKYLVTNNGAKITHYESKITPIDSNLENDIKAAL